MTSEKSATKALETKATSHRSHNPGISRALTDHKAWPTNRWTDVPWSSQMPTSTWSLTRSTSGQRVVNEWSTDGSGLMRVVSTVLRIRTKL
jgi:hypothetical protein